MATINGDDADNTLSGTGESDIINGLGGNDYLIAGDDPGARDTLNGGAGDDTLEFLASGGVADGGEGVDLIYLDYYLASTPIRYDGSGPNPTISGPAALTLISIERALIYGGSGDDVMIGGALDDIFGGGDGADQLTGGGGDDEVSGDAGADTLSGGDGDDDVSGGEDDDRLSGGAGEDRLGGDEGDDLVSGGAGEDDLSGFDGNDVLDGGSGDDDLDGGSGADRLISGEFGGADYMDGGDDVDLAVLSRVFTSRALTIDLSDTGRQDLADGTVLINVERLQIAGGFGDDSFTGGQYADALGGGGGDDRLQGADGDDVLFGGFGDDRLEGGAGFDVALFVGRRSDYRITRLDDGSYRVDGRKRAGEWDGTDIVSDVELFRFSDGDWLVG